MPQEIDASCGNCDYMRYNPNDITETERCIIVGLNKKEKPLINPLAKRLVEEGIPAICEYHHPTETLKNRIVYRTNLPSKL